MNVIQQGRLWGIRNPGSDVIFHAVETGLPTLFKTRKDADAFKMGLKKQHNIDIEIVEVQIIEKERLKNERQKP